MDAALREYTRTQLIKNAQRLLDAHTSREDRKQIRALIRLVAVAAEPRDYNDALCRFSAPAQRHC